MGKEQTPKSRPIRVRNISTAKRLLSNIILQVQKGEIIDTQARLLVYCLSAFVGIVKDHEFSVRLELLEKKINEKGKQ